MDLKEIIKKFHNHQFVRYLLVGVANTLFGYAVFVALLYFGLHYTLAAFFSVAIGAYFNFHTTGHFVFGSRHHSLLLKFLFVYLLIYILKVIGLFGFEKIGVNNYLGGAFLIIPLGLVSFSLNKLWVFKKN